MPQIDWSKTLFRASAIGELMTNPRSKSETLSDTTKKYLRKLHRSLKYGFYEEIQSKYFDKGNACEEDGITLYSRYKRTMYKSNRERIDNEFFTGIPDYFDGNTVRTAKWIYDNKSAWDWTTFPYTGDKLTKDYEYQGLVYCDLTGAKGATFVYTLIDTPEPLILSAIKSVFYKTGVEATEEHAAAIRRNMTFSDKMSIEERICEFNVEWKDDALNEVKERVPEWRKYLQFLDTPKIISV